MIARLVVALCAALPFAAAAFSSSSAGNVTTFGGFTATAGNVAPYAVSTASDGTVLVRGARSLSVAGGSIPVDVTGSIPRATAAGAVRRFLGKSIPLLGVGVAVFELAQELGFTLDNSGGSVVVQKANPLPAGYDGMEYKEANTAIAQLPWSKTKQLACDAWALYRTNTNNFQEYRCRNANTGPVNGQTEQRAKGSNDPWGIISDFTYARRTDPSPPSTAPVASSVAELEAAIAAKSGWPTTSKLAQATKDAIAANDPLPVASPVASGPATQTVSSTSTADPATGNTTTTVVQISNTYSGPTVTTSTTSTTSVTNTSTGAPVGQPVVTTATQPVTSSQPAEEAPSTLLCGLAGLPPCNVAVDETGMAVPTDIKTDQADDSFDDWDNFITNIGDVLPEFPTIAWDFALPTACGVIPLPAFEPAISEIDVCQFQPMFHQLMTVVWSLGALFGAISLFMKSSLST